MPRWARHAAVLAAMTPVLSSLWRLPLIFGFSMGMDDEFMADLMGHPFWQRAGYLTALGVASDGLAFLTLGLVSHWGEVFPRSIPFVGGRQVAPAAALVPAVLGGVLATYLWTTMALSWPDSVIAGSSLGVLVQVTAYAPLVLWGPLVLAVAAHYWWRRCWLPRTERVGAW